MKIKIATLIGGAVLSTLPFLFDVNLIISLICYTLGVYLCGFSSSEIVNTYIKPKGASVETQVVTTEAPTSNKRIADKPIRITVAAEATEGEIQQAVFSRASAVKGRPMRRGDDKFICIGDTYYPVWIIREDKPQERPQPSFVQPVQTVTSTDQMSSGFSY